MHRFQAISRILAHDVSRLPTEQRARHLESWWATDPNDKVWREVAPALRNEIASRPAPDDPAEGRYDPLLRISLRRHFVGVTNAYLEGRLAALGIADAVEGEVERLLACPCCRYLTLGRHGEYDICPVCFWEDCGARHPDDYSGPNHGTLAEGRANFDRIGACCDDMLAHVLPDGPKRYARNGP